MLGKLDIQMHKNETGPLSHPIYMKYNSKWIKDKYKSRKYKTTRQKHGEKFSWHWSVQWFLGYDPQNTVNESKNRQMDGIKLKSFCTSNKTSNRVNGKKY